MLSHLAIRNFLLIDRLDLDFSSGFSVLTGETGAGKSLLLDALAFVLGARGDSGSVRQGEDQASVQACFQFRSDACAAFNVLLERFGLPLLEVPSGLPKAGELWLRRLQMPQGKTRAFVNDCPVSLATLKAVCSGLVDIHGQFDTVSLLQSGNHLRMLDEYGGHEDVLLTCRERSHALRDAVRRYRDLALQSLNRQRDLDYYRSSVAELEQVAPLEDEDLALSQRRVGLQKLKKSVQLYVEGAQMLSSEGVSGQVLSLLRQLERMGVEEDQTLVQVCEMLSQSADLLGQAEGMFDDLSRDAHGAERELSTLEERLFLLKDLGRKYQCLPDQLPVLLEKMREKLQMLECDETQFGSLQQDIADLWSQYQDTASALSDARRRVAKDLELRVSREFPQLKLAQAEFRIQFNNFDKSIDFKDIFPFQSFDSSSGEGVSSAGVNPLLASELSRADDGAAQDMFDAFLQDSGVRDDGFDRVVFELKTNPGFDFAPLHKAASGGELSRFLLALRVAFLSDGAGQNVQDAQTLIFDEIDSGVGGAVADAIGERLKRLAGDGDVQVLAISHSPQVAARAKTHYFIEKHVRDEATITEVRLLDGVERRAEIARMLSGADITDAANAQADALLQAG